MITIENILECKKIINKKRRPDFQTVHRHYRMNLDLLCDAMDIKMVMFLRKSIELPDENFTVGLKINGPSFFAMIS